MEYHTIEVILICVVGSLVVLLFISGLYGLFCLCNHIHDKMLYARDRRTAKLYKEKFIKDKKCKEQKKHHAAERDMLIELAKYYEEQNKNWAILPYDCMVERHAINPDGSDNQFLGIIFKIDSSPVICRVLAADGSEWGEVKITYITQYIRQLKGRPAVRIFGDYHRVYEYEIVCKLKTAYELYHNNIKVDRNFAEEKEFEAYLSKHQLILVTPNVGQIN